MKQWVTTNMIDLSKLTGVISGRFGASVMFVAYEKYFRRWVWVYPGGAERINEPEMILVDENWARENRTLAQDHKAPPQRRGIRKKRVQQLELF